MIQIQEIKVEMLKLWNDNPRINDHAVGAVAKSIKTFGFNVPILCDQNYTIIAGHTRWKAAKKLSLDTVPVVMIEMPEKDRKAFSIADNKTAELSDWNFTKLREILESLRSEDTDLSNMGFSNEELRRLLKIDEPDEDEVPATEGSPITQTGDLWVLDRHRLLCGDSRDSDAVIFLTEGKQMDHIFGGPPYFNQRNYAQWSNFQTYIEDMERIIENCLKIIKDGRVIVWNIANEGGEHLDLTSRHSAILSDKGFSYLDTIIWMKTGANYAIPRNFHIKRNHLYYPAFQWEALLVFQKPGDMPRMTREGMEYMMEYHTNIWEIPAVTNQIETYGHPAVCPVEIPFRSMQAYSGGAAMVFEPFGGSGTTLIAAEKAQRRAFVIEQHPVYCDMIVKRWEKLTGHKATLVTSKH